MKSIILFDAIKDILQFTFLSFFAKYFDSEIASENEAIVINAGFMIRFSKLTQAQITIKVILTFFFSR